MSEKFGFKVGRSGDFVRLGMFESIVPIDGSAPYRYRTLVELDLTAAQALNMGRQIIEAGAELHKEERDNG